MNIEAAAFVRAIGSALSPEDAVALGLELIRYGTEGMRPAPASGRAPVSAAPDTAWWQTHGAADTLAGLEAPARVIPIPDPEDLRVPPSVGGSTIPWRSRP